MNKFNFSLAIVAYYLSFSFSQAFSQQQISDTTSLTLRDYEINQFIKSSDSSPQSIMELDNNGEIIMDCLSGKTREQLRSDGIKFVESQIKLLKTWRMLKEDNDILTVSFPMLNIKETNQLRNYSIEAVSILIQKLEPNILRFIAMLDSIGRVDNGYTILFSYVLDDLVWKYFREKGLLEDREITAEMPFWAGELWLIYPPRSFSMGTNTISDKGVSLKVNWTEKAIPHMIPFVADWKNFGRLFNDYVEKGKVENEEAKTIFTPFNLFDASGYFTVPIINENKDDSFYLISCQLAEQVANEVPIVFDFATLRKKFNILNDEQMLIIIYHEWMWDFMDYLEYKGFIKKPVAFLNPEIAKPSDIGDLVFIVRDSN